MKLRRRLPPADLPTRSSRVSGADLLHLFYHPTSTHLRRSNRNIIGLMFLSSLLLALPTREEMKLSWPMSPANLPTCQRLRSGRQLAVLDQEQSADSSVWMNRPATQSSLFLIIEISVLHRITPIRRRIDKERKAPEAARAVEWQTYEKADSHRNGRDLSERPGLGGPMRYFDLRTRRNSP